MSRTVIGVALNFQATLDRLTSSFDKPPYLKPPSAPVLYLKTPNTWIGDGDPIPCPADCAALRIAGTLGAVIGGGYLVAIDVSIPHESFYRPAIRQRCSDGFCVLARNPKPLMVEPVAIRVFINGELRSSASTAQLVRPIPQLLADISEFMTLHPGDIVLAGEPEDSPLAKPGDEVRIEIPGLGTLTNPIVRAV